MLFLVWKRDVWSVAVRSVAVRSVAVRSVAVWTVAVWTVATWILPSVLFAQPTVASDMRLEQEVEIQQQQRRIDELEAEHRSHTYLTFVSGVAMTLAGLALLYSFYGDKVRASRAIEQKNRELEKALEELRQSEKRYRRLFMDPAIGKVVLDPIAETILDVNQPARALLGHPREDLVGATIQELECDWLLRMFYRSSTESSQESRTVVEVFEHVDNGVHRYFEAWVSPLDLSGRPAALLTLNDVTERRNLEQERVRQEERERYIAELEDRKAEAEVRNAEMERFTYTVSHDLKSPLFTIRGFLGFLKRDLDGGELDELKKNIDHIESAVVKMARLLDELLELSRVGRVANPPQVVSMSELVEEVAQTLSATLAESGATLHVCPDLADAFGDRERLGEVLQNLVENGVKFSREGVRPQVEIGSRAGVGRSVFYVRDNGEGIEPKYHDKVFGLFERLDAQVDGSGVGLALVKRIVEVHGGKIWVESEGKGCGSTFLFDLAAAPSVSLAAT